MVKVSRVFHASYILECQGTRLLFDPLFESPFSKNCYAFPDVQFDHQAISQLMFDAVFISHFHDDHFSFESLQFLNREIPVYLYSVDEELHELLRQFGFLSVYKIEINKPLSIGSFEVIPREALDRDIDSIYHIRASGLNILNVVDSWIGPSTIEKLKDVKKWDLILWPFQTMRELEVIAPSQANSDLSEVSLLPPEWCEQLKVLNPYALVPSSCQFRFEEWSWYNQAFFPISYAGFERQIHQILPQTKVCRLDPGESIHLLAEGTTDRSEQLFWVKPKSPRHVDYEFDPTLTPPPMGEIAQRFTPLSKEQKEQVKFFCQVEMIEKFASLALFENSFFSQARFWKLKIYSATGELRCHDYRVFQNELKQIPSTDELAWVTEICEAKLWGALMEGESMTSIYLRVHPLSGADLFEDPLIRCLYEGAVGSYQKAQLKTLSRKIGEAESLEGPASKKNL